MTVKLHRCRRRETVFFLLFYLLVFQNPLTAYVSPLFSYVDEAFALLGILLPAYLGFHPQKRLTIRHRTVRMAIPLAAFAACGLGANLIYGYQPLMLVLKDLYINLKFFLAVSAGFYLLRHVRPDSARILGHAKLCAAILFALLLSDVALDIFPGSGRRYGIKVRNLIFGHVTYLAGICVFLLAVFLLYYEKKNLKYMAMALLVLISTTRSKALAGAIAYVAVLYLVLVRQQKVRLRHILLIGLIGICIAWEQIRFYYVELSGQSARSVLTQTAFQIMKDYFPLGTGFGTYGSDVAAQHYSPVYEIYGFTSIYELRKGSAFFSDTFWPIIIGQTGFAGTVWYLLALLRLFRNAAAVRPVSNHAYGAVLFVFIYLLISATSEPAFNNAVSIPSAMLLGWVLQMRDDAEKRGKTP